MTKLKNWKARRSGGRITITGVDETGESKSIANIDAIEVNPSTGSVFAFHRDGHVVQLDITAETA